WAGELASMSAGSGRHNRLLELARSAGGLVGSGLLTQHETEDALYAACQSNRLVADDGEVGVRRALRDGLAHGQTEPWVPDDLPDSPAWTRRLELSRNGHLQPTSNGVLLSVGGEVQRTSNLQNLQKTVAGS